MDFRTGKSSSPLKLFVTPTRSREIAWTRQQHLIDASTASIVLQASQPCLREEGVSNFCPRVPYPGTRCVIEDLVTATPEKGDRLVNQQHSMQTADSLAAIRAEIDAGELDASKQGKAFLQGAETALRAVAQR